MVFHSRKLTFKEITIIRKTVHNIMLIPVAYTTHQVRSVCPMGINMILLTVFRRLWVLLKVSIGKDKEKCQMPGVYEMKWN